MKRIELIPSGISLVDNVWGGIYRGGTYLLIGAHKTGRTLLSLQFAMESAALKESCLYFTSMKPKDLMIQSASINFDISTYTSQGLINIVRAAPPANLYEMKNPDKFLAEYMNDMIHIIEQYQPQRIVFDELTPFIGFENIEILRESFSHTTELIEEAGITSMYVVGDPATAGAKQIIDILAKNVTGIFYLQKGIKESKTHVGRFSITPNIGHTEGKASALYNIEPNKGLVIDLQGQSLKNFSVPMAETSGRNKYTPLNTLDIPFEDYTYSNIYSFNDFTLLLNNQIALFNSTGQTFQIFSFMLERSAESKGILTINQLKNSIRLSVDKKDKICLIDNKVLVLMTKEDPKIINSLASRIRTNLPYEDNSQAEAVMSYVSYYHFVIDESVKSAEDVFELVINEKAIEANKE